MPIEPIDIHELTASGPAGLWPKSMRSMAGARIAHRLAMHVPVKYFRLRAERPIVSFTFDDIPNSAATTGADILGERDVHGTFYVAGNLVGSHSSDWQHASDAELIKLHRLGHEIGCHTFSHKKAFELDKASLASEADRNLGYFRELDPTIKLENFAYPWGLGNFPLKKTLEQKFRSCRSVMPGVNHGQVDLQFLRATPLIERSMDAASIDRFLDRTVETNGWLIFYSHDIKTIPSDYGCSPSLLKLALGAAKRRGMLVASVAEALEYVGV